MTLVALEWYSFRLHCVPCGIHVHVFDPGEESVVIIGNKQVESIVQERRRPLCLAQLPVLFGTPRRSV